MRERQNERYKGRTNCDVGPGDTFLHRSHIVSRIESQVDERQAGIKVEDGSF